MDARPWDFQAEECSLRTCVDRFNSRRYMYGTTNRAINNGMNTNNAQPSGTIGEMNDMEQQCDYNINNILGDNGLTYNPGFGGWDENIDLSEEFKQNYELWLQQEVFNTEINWDSLLVPVDL